MPGSSPKLHISKGDIGPGIDRSFSTFGLLSLNLFVPYKDGFHAAITSVYF